MESAPLNALRIAASVPALIQAAHRLGGELAHAEFGDDAGTTVAAEADRLLIVLLLRQPDMKNSGNLCRSVGAWKNIPPSQLEGGKIRLLRLGPVFKFDPGPVGTVVVGAAVDGAVVPTGDLAQTACIAAATDVFQ